MDEKRDLAVLRVSGHPVGALQALSRQKPLRNRPLLGHELLLVGSPYNGLSAAPLRAASSAPSGRA